MLVIPAFREGLDFFLRLRNTLLTQRACLLILVVNQPDTEPAANADNSELWRSVCAVTTAIGAPFTTAATHCALRGIGSSHSAVLLVDRFDRGTKLPAREGVGRARKIGADIALALIAASVVASRWIHSSDADAHLPLDYFFAVPKAAAAVAGVLPFRHRCGDDAVGAATRLYELSLEYHVAGLRWAASPYGFHSVGSALVVRADAYAQVRGFPRRAGGEDFYLLNKLAKIGEVLAPTAPVIELDARASTRVPFGTGPAVARLVSRLDAGEDLTSAAIFHHPEVFRQLQAVPHRLAANLSRRVRGRRHQPAKPGRAGGARLCSGAQSRPPPQPQRDAVCAPAQHLVRRLQNAEIPPRAARPRLAPGRSGDGPDSAIFQYAL